MNKNIFNSDKLLSYSLSIVFIIFGFLKVIDKSPVEEIVQKSFFLFEYDIVFLLLGLGEMLLGLGLLFRKTRKLAALGIILHLLAVTFTALLNPSLTFSSETILTFYGEFVVKNLALIAVSWKIFENSK